MKIDYQNTLLAQQPCKFLQPGFICLKRPDRLPVDTTKQIINYQINLKLLMKRMVNIYLIIQMVKLKLKDKMKDG